MGSVMRSPPVDNLMRGPHARFVLPEDEVSRAEAVQRVRLQLFPTRSALGDPTRNLCPYGRRLLEPGPAPPDGEVQPLRAFRPQNGPAVGRHVQHPGPPRAVGRAAEGRYAPSDP